MDLSNYQPFQQRVIVEAQELHARIEALATALANPDFVAKLKPVDLSLLQEQKQHMDAYYSVLRRRIQGFEVTFTAESGR